MRSQRYNRAYLKLLVGGLTLLFALLIVPGAVADGLPVLGIDVGSTGVALRGGSVRYVALRSGRETTVARIAVASGRVLAFRRLAGNLTVPAVAYDGSASGLSADGATLALIEPRTRFPRARTSFAILDARRLTVSRRVSLRGDFSFDAISPEGRTMFLIQYTSAKDPTRYDVRAFDLDRGLLLGSPVVDPRERGEAMRLPDHANDERGRALGVHVLRRRRQDTVRSRARHAQAPRALHRPADRQRPRRSLDASPTPHRRRDARARECPPDRGADRPEELSSKRSRGHVDVRGPSPAGRITARARWSPRPVRVCRAHPRAQAFANRHERGCSGSARESSHAPVQSGVRPPPALLTL